MLALALRAPHHDPDVCVGHVKALVEGKIDTFLGFKFIRSERLPKTGTARFCLAWAKTGLRLGIGKDIVTSIDRLPGKDMSVQAYASMSLGAVRTEAPGEVRMTSRLGVERILDMLASEQLPRIC